MNSKPDVLQLVEKQTHKSYGKREGGKTRIECHNVVSICWQCGEKRVINSCGVCDECWEKFSFLREGCK